MPLIEPVESRVGFNIQRIAPSLIRTVGLSILTYGDSFENIAIMEAEVKRPHNLGDSLGMVGLVVALIVWVLVPTLVVKVIVLVFASAGAGYLVHKSHWTGFWSPRRRHLTVVVIVAVLLAWGGWQLMGQWVNEHSQAETSLDLAVQLFNQYRLRSQSSKLRCC